MTRENIYPSVFSWSDAMQQQVLLVSFLWIITQVMQGSSPMHKANQFLDSLV